MLHQSIGCMITVHSAVLHVKSFQREQIVVETPPFVPQLLHPAQTSKQGLPRRRGRGDRPATARCIEQLLLRSDASIVVCVRRHVVPNFVRVYRVWYVPQRQTLPGGSDFQDITQVANQANDDHAVDQNVCLIQHKRFELIPCRASFA